MLNLSQPLAVRFNGVLYPVRNPAAGPGFIMARAYGDPFRQVSNNTAFNFRNLRFDSATGLCNDKAYPESELINVDADMLDPDVDPDTGFERKVPISEARRMVEQALRDAPAAGTPSKQRIVFTVADGEVEVVSVGKVA